MSYFCLCFFLSSRVFFYSLVIQSVAKNLEYIHVGVIETLRFALSDKR